MIKVNIHDAKTNLSRYVESAEGGETVVLCRHNVPVVQLSALEQPTLDKRKLGFARKQFGAIELDQGFFEPLPDELLKYFSVRSHVSSAGDHVWANRRHTGPRDSPVRC